MATRGKPCQTVCTGLYSCRWSQANDRTRARSKRRACCWFCILLLSSLLAAVWLYICMMAYNDRDDINWKAFNSMKHWVNWYLVAVVFYATLAVYSFLLLLFSLFQIALGEPLDHLHCLHKVLLFVAVLLISIGFGAMSWLWLAEWYTISLSLQATVPFLHLGGLGALTLLSAFIFQSIFKAKRSVSKMVIVAVFIALSAVLFLAPLLFRSPCLLDVLPEKPALIGHRGAPMLAPENTLMSFRRSLDCNVTTFETDVLISKDGVPFLMHDSGLQRTTNVLDQFPEKAGYKSDNFTWEELKMLDAGSWFLKNDPFHTASSLSEQEQATTRKQTIPSFYELLELAKERKMSVMFDLKDDTDDRNDTVNVLLDVINNSSIPHNQVLWLPPLDRMGVKRRAPQFQYIYKNQTEMELNRDNRLNLKYNSISFENIRELQQKNVTLNLWVVNQRWLFSLFWCAGVHSVTTNACHDLNSMAQPVWHLSPSAYKIIWISADVSSLLIMTLVFYLMRKRMSRDQAY